MKDKDLTGINEVKDFLEQSQELEFERRERSDAYQWIEKTLKKFDYLGLRKKEKSIVKRYIEKMSGYTGRQVTNLITKYREEGEVKVQEYDRHKFESKYTPKDVRLLAKTIEKHEYLNGAAVKRNLKRMADVYGKQEYKRLSDISVSHIYNLRKTATFRRAVIYYRGTQSKQETRIGKREKPRPGGKPGFIRVDTVEQGSTRAGGGVYHIDTVDEKTQWQVVGSVPNITKEHMVPLLEKIIKDYPFRIINFHADNGSEYINQYVAKLLNDLLIELTKSRPRHTNDNALAETKHTIIRKWIRYGYIPKKGAPALNKFYFGCFNEYLNYHHPCGFPIEEVDRKGKVRKKYPQDCYRTPYEKLKTLPDAEKYLKEGITFEEMDKVELKCTDNEMADKVKKERSRLFDRIKKVA